MAKTKISEFSSTAGNNTDIDSINIAEGCAPSGINNAIRELMAQLKDFQTGAAGDSFNGPVGTTTAAAGAFTTLSASGTTTLSGLTASTALALDASKNVVSVTNTGTGNNVLATSPTLVTPILGTPTSVTLTNATGLPISTGVSGLGTGIATALAVNVGSAGAPVINGGALGTPSSGTVTNLTGTASININGTVGATTANTGAFTTLTTSSTVTLNGGTANGVAYLNGSKVLTTGSALTFDGTNLGLGIASPSSIARQDVQIAGSTSNAALQIRTFDAGTVDGSTTAKIIRAVNSGGGNWANAQYDAWSHIWTQAGSEQMRLTSTGLGIGTSSPVAKFQVVGASGAGIRVDQGNYNYYGAYTHVWLNSGFSSTFMTLDSSGNLGLGVTPSAWQAALGKVIQLGTGASLVGDSGAPRLRSVANAYFDGSNWRYIADGYATYMYQNGSTGETSWQQAPSGTAGNAISFTQALSLTAAGNLLLGGTTDPGGTKVLYIGNGTTPGTPTSGGVLYVESGALKYKGSSGTVTTLGAA